ncbi:class I SAM-dependent methyltransferase [Sinorhizobium sp. BG8]|uniref:class I SAM-dependent methyltransferase n=1 Tax=Sinorhizobium sp. BG8 TaxID=2613773 RepID=UPI00193DA07C|nr:class I SAM-dependent methyltransferase [Sinorhizobium sp. BG8]QRM56643.1 class I SAM-dependent methyltransferase [Sinorhizobium sp. BG8]
MLSPVDQAFIDSETRQAELLAKTGWRVEEPRTSLIANTVVRPRSSFSTIDADYYQRLHDEDAGYRGNNWLVAETPSILAAKPDTIVEIGCGNGAFSKSVASKVRKVFAVDWAKSPLLEVRPKNVLFRKANITKDKIPGGDLTCSADVLEHFTPSDLPTVISKCASSSPLQYHVIACYDDGHSHLTVMSPAAWLALFWRFCPDARLTRIDCRRKKSNQLVCVVTNVPNGSEVAAS